MTVITLTFGELAALLAARHNIASHKLIAFHGRIKNLLHAGLLPDAKPGRGKVGRYTRAQGLKIAVAIEMVAMGVSPDFTVEVLDHCSSALDPIWIGASRPPIIAILPEALAGLGDDCAPKGIVFTSFDSLTFLRRTIVVDLRSLYEDPLLKRFDPPG